MTLSELLLLAGKEIDFEEIGGSVFLDSAAMLERINAGGSAAHEIEKCRWRMQWADRGNRRTHNETFFKEGFLSALPSSIAGRVR
jgi:hypothetical protein